MRLVESFKILESIIERNVGRVNRSVVHCTTRLVSRGMATTSAPRPVPADQCPPYSAPRTMRPGRPPTPPHIRKFFLRQNIEIYQRVRKFEADFRDTNVFVASDPPFLLKQ